MAAQFEIRQRNLKVARQILENAIGMAPKDKGLAVNTTYPELDVLIVCDPGLKKLIAGIFGKASQLKVHATRLNEAFSMIRRAPIIRPSLTSGGLTPWSVVSL
ncbi:hypothetical protein ZIOFF_035646 [Zingiber officinale]|uniref:Uncharacterized protein n=1 Tax=Zingiber officinale TaxID=94328 RepID=A0A8J5L785_ZINOF|nr:hypothetical protein ZIOFF_035646 [Zingiber officinale]